MVVGVDVAGVQLSLPFPIWLLKVIARVMTMRKVVLIGGEQINCATEPHQLTYLPLTRQAVKASALARSRCCLNP